MEKLSRVGLVGYGYWGKKLGNVFQKLGVLEAVVDTDESVKIPFYRYTDLHDMLIKSNIDSVAIATPPETHYDLARMSLEAGKHVFVEKPLSTSAYLAEKLVDKARFEGLSLRVGHTYLYCPGFELIPYAVGKTEIYVRLLNVGGHPMGKDRPVIWAGLPHAVSVALSIMKSYPCSIKVYTKSMSEVKVKLEFWEGSEAYLQVKDHANVRMREVEVRSGEYRYNFSADHPYYLMYNGNQCNMYTSSEDPLTLVLESYIKYPGQVDSFAIDVVKVLEMIDNAADS